MSIEAPLGATSQGGSFDIAGTTSAVVEPTHTLTARRPRAWSERAALAAVASIPLVGLFLCIAGTRTPQLAPQSIQLALPPSFAGPFYHLGFTLRTGEVIAAVVVMLLAYMFAVWQAERVPARVVISSIVALNLIVLVGPPLFSTDVFSYQAYAKMFTLYQTNPYTHGPSVIQLDPLYPYIGAKWIATPTVYGPLFTFLSGAFASASVTFSEFAFKLIAAAASFGTLFFIWKSAERRGLNPVRGIALFGLSPLVTIFGVGGGHNDLLMLMLSTAGIYAMLSRRERGAGALITASAAIKLTGGLLLPFALLSGVELDARRRRRAFLVGAAAVTVVVAAASGAAFGTGVFNLTHTLQQAQYQGSWQSLPGFILAIVGLPVTGWIHTAVAVGLVGWVLWLMRKVWKGEMDWIDGAAWATFAVLITAWSLLPWYAAWLMPLVALGTSRRLWSAAMWMTVLAGAVMVADCFPNGLNL